MKKNPKRSTSAPPQSAIPEDGVLPSQQNWLMKVAAGKQSSQPIVYEYPLYTDAHITGEFRSADGPYTFLNTVPIPTFDGEITAPIVVRAEMYLPTSIPDMSRTDESLYHGGELVDEIVALASLSLGIRLLSGGTSREFRIGGDPYGRPCEWAREPKPAFRFRRNQLVLPSVGTSHSMEDLQRLESVPRIEPTRYVSLIRACKSYQEGLWASESDPNLAWLLFVSALETAANDVFNVGSTSTERLRTAKPEFARRLEELGGRENLKMVADEISHTLDSTKKFIDFAMKFAPRVPKKRPKGKSLKLNWSKSNLKRVFRKVYDYRSRALHTGVPFPAPMFRPPFVTQANEVGSEVPIGLGSYSSGGTWIPKDVPINLHTFHYITRHALLNWWEKELVQAQDNARATRRGAS